MTNKDLHKAETKKQVKNSTSKGIKCTVEHHKPEIINKDELERRTGFTGDNTEILSAFLHKLDNNEAHLNFSKKLKDLATYIYEIKILYVSSKGGYKPMELSSIETELSNIRCAEKEQLIEKQRELEEKENKKRILQKRY